MLMLRHGFCHVETAKARVVLQSVATNKARANAHGKKLTSCEPTPSMFETEGMGSEVFLVESI